MMQSTAAIQCFKADVRNPLKQLPILCAGLSAALLVSGAHVASGQSYSIDWFTIDGGGGTSTGGVYRLSGTIGQPDAGTMSGGPYTLVGGFWGVVSAIQTQGAPYLKVMQDKLSGRVTVSWPLPATGYVLEQATGIDVSPAGWIQVPFPYVTNATAISVSVPLPAGNRFYRLRNP
jgi:hypothetical protein